MSVQGELSADSSALAALFADHAERLGRIPYLLVGSVPDAEDVVAALSEVASSVTVETADPAIRRSRSTLAAVLCGIVLIVGVVIAWTRIDRTAGGTTRLSVARIVGATSAVRGYRFSAIVVLPVGGANTFVQTGETNGAQTLVTLTIPGEKGTESFVFDGRSVFERNDSANPSIAHDWCVPSGLTRVKGSGPQVDPLAALSSLTKGGRHLEEVGHDVVRGVDTTHYQVSGSPPVEVWVDSSDRLRQLKWIEDKRTLETAEFFDFGAAISIVVPAKASPCKAAKLPTHPRG